MTTGKGKGDGKNDGRQHEPEIQVDLSLGDLFKGIGGFLDLVNKMDREGKTEIKRTGQLGGPGKASAVYGFSMRMGIGGKPLVEKFGNIKETESGSVVQDIREPLTDVFDEEDHVVVVMEMPGVEIGDVTVNVVDERLTVAARGADRRYGKTVLLPSKVETKSLEKSYINGILEIRFQKAH